MTHDLTVCPRVATNVKSLSKHCLNERFYKNPIEKLLQMMLIHYSVNFTVAGHFFFAQGDQHTVCSHECCRGSLRTSSVAV